MKTQYNDLAELIKTQMPEVRHIDLYRGQYLNTADYCAWDTPAVFIEFQPIQWQNLGQNCQQGILMPSFHLVIGNLAATRHQDTPEPDALDFLSLIDKLHTALQGCIISQCNELMRDRTDFDQSFDQLYVCRLSYRCLIDDYQTHLKRKYIETTATVKVIRKS